MADQLKELNTKVKDLIDGLKTNFQKAADKVGGHVSEVMGDEMKMVSEDIKSGFEIVKNSGTKTLKFFGSLFTWQSLGLNEDKKQTKYQKEIHGMMKYLFKLRLTSTRRGKKFLSELFDFIGIPLIAVGAVIGGIVATIVKPFQVIGRGLKALGGVGKLFLGLLLSSQKIMNMVTSFLKESRIVQKLLPMIMKVGKVFNTIGRVFNALINLPGVRFLARGLRFGFQKLFWPLQIIISAIDFVQGFIDAEGNILDKIQSGIRNVLVKFFEFPIQILGGILDWVLSGFGIERKKGETARMLLNMFTNTINMIFEGWELIIKGLIDGANWVLNKINEISWDGLVDSLKDWGKMIVEIPGRIKDKILDWLGFGEVRDETKPEIASPIPAKLDVGIKSGDADAIVGALGENEAVAATQRDKSNNLLEKIAAYMEMLTQKEGGTPVLIPPAEGTRQIPATTEIQPEAYGYMSVGGTGGS